MVELYGLWVQWLVVVVFQVDTVGFVSVCGCGLNFMGCGGWGAAIGGGWVDFMDLISTVDLV